MPNPYLMFPNYGNDFNKAITGLYPNYQPSQVAAPPPTGFGTADASGSFRQGIRGVGNYLTAPAVWGNMGVPRQPQLPFPGEKPAGGPSGPVAPPDVKEVLDAEKNGNIDDNADLRAQVRKELGGSFSRYSDVYSQLQNLASSSDPAAQALQQRLAATQGRESQMNLAPLMALSDQWFGGNLAGTYAATQPFTDQAKAQQVAALEQAIANRQSTAQDSERKALSDALQAEAYREQVLGGLAKSLSPEEGKKSLASTKEDRLLRQEISGVLDKQRVPAGVKVIEKLQAIHNWVDKNGLPPIYGDKYKEYERLQNSLLIDKKDIDALGALAGADVEIETRQIGAIDRQGIIGMYMGGDTKEGFMERIRKNIEAIKAPINRTYSSLRKSLEGVEGADKAVDAHYDEHKKILGETSSADEDDELTLALKSRGLL